MAVYLQENPPAISQYRSSRRAAPSGVVVLHTAESIADVNPPDNGAESVARFIANRTNYGSYHAIVDADSIVQLCEWWWEAWHVGTYKMNYHSVGISVAAEAAKWNRYPSTWVEGAVDNAAKAAARYNQWLIDNHGITIPAKRINVTQAIYKTPGFTTHGELDPSRRTDPGDDFPWDLFLDRYRQHAGGDIDMLNDAQQATVQRIQRALIDAGYDLGSWGADGDPGPMTEAAILASLDDLSESRTDLARSVNDLKLVQADLDECRDEASRDTVESRIGRGFMDLVRQVEATPDTNPVT